jgi:hypothetical protein
MLIRVALKSLLFPLQNDKQPISLNILLQSLLPLQQHGQLHDEFPNMYCHVDTGREPDIWVFLRQFVRLKQRKSVSQGVVEGHVHIAACRYQ